jgi:hypothetical protein
VLPPHRVAVAGDFVIIRSPGGTAAEFRRTGAD